MNWRQESNPFAGASVAASRRTAVAVVGRAALFVAFATKNKIFFKLVHNFLMFRLCFRNEPQSSNELSVLPRLRSLASATCAQSYYCRAGRLLPPGSKKRLAASKSRQPCPGKMRTRFSAYLSFEGEHMRMMFRLVRLCGITIQQHRRSFAGRKSRSLLLLLSSRWF